MMTNLEQQLENLYIQKNKIEDEIELLKEKIKIEKARSFYYALTAEAKEDAKKQVKDQQEANKIKIDSAKISTPEPGATFKIRRN